jgi:cysteinyl-tRNA synthetase
MTLYLYNTLTRKKEAFTPIDPNNIRMYVCGPTVYDRAHLGNARSVVVYDVLFRFLKHVYGAEHVTYVRNITDVDDKINAAAKERKIPIQHLTQEVIGWFHEDMKALNVLPANNDKNAGMMIEPKATDHIPQMIKIIERLIKNGKAYVAKGNALFSVKSMPEYGKLSGRIQDDLEAGARVKVEGYKKDPGDFVLWKPALADDDPSSVFQSPWGKGRPGWHIECSAMSTEYLGQDFDIHGGGSDLMFPHHENEIAQSCGAFPGSHFANYWVHNGFLTVNGEKMSKSLGNFITVRDLLDKGIKGEVVRYALLKTKYNEPLDWSEKLLSDAKKELDTFYGRIQRDAAKEAAAQAVNVNELIENALGQDLNVPALLSMLHANTGAGLKQLGNILGILQQNPEEWFKGTEAVGDDVESLITARNEAKKAKNWAEADKIRNELKSQGILLEDKPDGSTNWRRA